MSKEYRLRMPDELFEGITEAAELKNMTTAGFCREAIAAYLKAAIDYDGQVHLSWGGSRPGAGRPISDNPGQEEG